MPLGRCGQAREERDELRLTGRAGLAKNALQEEADGVEADRSERCVIAERVAACKRDREARFGRGQPFGLTVTQMLIGAAKLPGAGLPTSIRSAVTSSPVASVKLAHGFGIRLKLIF